MPLDVDVRHLGVYFLFYILKGEGGGLWVFMLGFLDTKSRVASVVYFWHTRVNIVPLGVHLKLLKSIVAFGS